jgi:hypothetical protein
MGIRHAAGFVALLASALGLVACGESTDTTSSSTTTASNATTTTTAPPGTTSSTEAPAQDVLVRAYFLRDEVVGPVARQATDGAVAAGAVQGLLAGPSPAEKELGFTSVVPAGTELRGITVDDRIATVDLSRSFTSGGGSASMTGRVAQVVFTLTQFPTIEAVRFKVDGEPLTVLGGEGLLLEEPQTRAHWEDLSPTILVESPLPFAETRSPLRITGTANTFEAALRVNVTDGEGLIVYDRGAMATSGTGTRGTFDVTATFKVPREGTGSVIVFEESAEDGHPIHIVEIPVHISR